MIELNKIYHANCLDVIKLLENDSIPVCITDFPYGIDFQSNYRIASKKLNKISNDKEPYTEWISPLWHKMKEGGRLICFYRYDVQNELFKAITDAGFIIKSQLIWYKNGASMGDLKGSFSMGYELMVYATKGRYEFPSGRPNGFYQFNGGTTASGSLTHPNEKPINLMRKLVTDISIKGELIFDPFSGSGSTCVAAKTEGRNFLGCDIEEKYVDLGNRRLNQVIDNEWYC